MVVVILGYMSSNNNGPRARGWQGGGAAQGTEKEAKGSTLDRASCLPVGARVFELRNGMRVRVNQ